MERYDGDGNEDMPGLKVGIKYWEVSNEPTMQEGRLIFFKGTSQDYLKILKVLFLTLTSRDKYYSMLIKLSRAYESMLKRRGIALNEQGQNEKSPHHIGHNWSKHECTLFSLL
ncbi:hypothetical protein ACFLVO_04945 [Chloroflexota bacterium]